MKRIRIVIADDHALIRDGYQAILSDEPDLNVVGQAAEGKELIQLLKHTEVDIIVLDVEMPGMAGDEALQIIKRRFPDVKIVIVSMHYSDNLVNSFLSKGANAYLPKGVDGNTLIKAIRSVAETGQYLDDQTSSAMLRGLIKEKGSWFDEQRLTEQEENILRLLCKGKTIKEIADIMKISPRTVTFHRENISEKTKIKEIPQLVVYAIRKGIIDINDPDY